MSDNTKDTSDDKNVHGTPGSDADSDTASGGSPAQPETTDPQGAPVDNPSGG